MSGGTGAVSGHRLTYRSLGVPEPASGVGTAFACWPYVSELELAALPSAVSCGRLHTGHVLREWQLDQLADDAKLLASELLANAVKASASPHGAGLVALRLLADRDQLLIEVWDESPDEPQLRMAGDTAEGGRGLVVIEALSNRWGFRHVRSNLKVVWCELLVRRADLPGQLPEQCCASTPSTP